MSLNQIKSLIVGVLKGWFTNKTVLDKFAEDENGKLTFDGAHLGDGETYTDEEVSTAVSEILSELNAEVEEGETEE